MRIKSLALIICLGISGNIAAFADDMSETETTVNGADVSDFLGSGPFIDRDAMDAAARKQEKWADLDPHATGTNISEWHPFRHKKQVASTESASYAVQTGSLNQADSSQSTNSDSENQGHERRHPLRTLGKGLVKTVEKVGNEAGFPIGPDVDNGTENEDAW